MTTTVVGICLRLACCRLLHKHKNALAANSLILLFLVIYCLLGGLAFLHFEHSAMETAKFQKALLKMNCVEDVLHRHYGVTGLRDLAQTARHIVDSCEEGTQPEREDLKERWSFRTAALYGFGILTTLGYGKIQPETTNGRCFAVLFGFVGIPITVIILTNLGRYFEQLAVRLKQKIDGVPPVPNEDDEVEYSISPPILFLMIMLYLLFGAIFVPLLNGQFDFLNGFYYAFICLTAIEFGDLIPDSALLIPLVIVYVCVGLAISTIALDVGSMYVRRLHYIGRRLKNIAHMKIWFGSKSLKMQELVNAVGQDIGIPHVGDIDLDELIAMAIDVKEGRLDRVPQRHMIIEGIWPPALVPLFIKDGHFPVFVDSDDDLLDETTSTSVASRRAVNRKQQSVRFDDEALYSDTEDATSDFTTTIISNPRALFHSIDLTPPLARRTFQWHNVAKDVPSSSVICNPNFADSSTALLLSAAGGTSETSSRKSNSPPPLIPPVARGTASILRHSSTSSSFRWVAGRRSPQVQIEDGTTAEAQSNPTTTTTMTTNGLMTVVSSSITSLRRVSRRRRRLSKSKSMGAVEGSSNGARPKTSTGPEEMTTQKLLQKEEDIVSILNPPPIPADPPPESPRSPTSRARKFGKFPIFDHVEYVDDI